MNLGGRYLKNKKALMFLILVLIVTSVFSYQYLKLRQEYIILRRDAKYNFTKYLTLSLSSANVVDINKINTGDKKSILSLREMYKEISNSTVIAGLSFRDNFFLVDQSDMMTYQLALKKILDKTINNKLTEEDGQEIKLIIEDLTLIKKYVDENDNCDMKKYHTEIRPKLKFIKIPYKD